VTGAQIQAYINQKSGIDFSKVFQQYLTTTKIPVLEYKNANSGTAYRWTNVVAGFAMPVKANGAWLKPTEAWKSMAKVDTVVVDRSFYVQVKRVP
jgi:hypothetical protein